MINLFLIDFKLYLISSARRKEKKEKQKTKMGERNLAPKEACIKNELAAQLARFPVRFSLRNG